MAASLSYTSYNTERKYLEKNIRSNSNNKNKLGSNISLFLFIYLEDNL